MPIYEYVCESCEHEFETIQRMSDAALTRCPACGKDRLRKKISAVAFRLKGGGWYETDFKSGDKKNVASSGDGGESGSTSAAPTKEAKSETKSSSDGATTSTASTSKPAKESSKTDRDSGGKGGASKNGGKRSGKTGGGGKSAKK
jgi:putative FmdB family regulatory protein